MRPSTENKRRTSSIRSTHGNYYKEIYCFSNRCIVLTRNGNRVVSYSKINRLACQKRKRLITSYRLCRNTKRRILDGEIYYPNAALSLIDKFRNILNLMLEDEAGSYPKNEILEVSRELDEIIYFYYKTKDMTDGSPEVAVDKGMYL